LITKQLNKSMRWNNYLLLQKVIEYIATKMELYSINHHIQSYYLTCLGNKSNLNFSVLYLFQDMLELSRSDENCITCLWVPYIIWDVPHKMFWVVYFISFMKKHYMGYKNIVWAWTHKYPFLNYIFQTPIITSIKPKNYFIILK